jgi:hypothetical protein
VFGQAVLKPDVGVATKLSGNVYTQSIGDDLIHRNSITENPKRNTTF